VIGHHHVSHQDDFVASANFAKRVDKDVSRPPSPQQRQSPVATESHEVELPLTKVAFQTFWHIQPPPRVNPTRGAPSLIYIAVSSKSGILSSMHAVKHKRQEIARATRPLDEHRGTCTDGSHKHGSRE
jgi:hypothetical protein